MEELDEMLSFLSLEMKPICRKVMQYMSSWIKAWTKIAGELCIVSFSIVYRTSLLDICYIVNSISISCHFK